MGRFSAKAGRVSLAMKPGKASGDLKKIGAFPAWVVEFGASSFSDCGSL